MPLPITQIGDATESQAQLARTWTKFEQLSARLTHYLKVSEAEFGGLIEALDACWNMAENVQRATTRLAELTGSAGDGQTAAIRDSMLQGCGVFRKFLAQIEGVGSQLASAAGETRSMLGTSNSLQADLGPLKYIAFHFRLEGSRLSPEDNASIAKVYEELQDVLRCMKQSGDSQEHTLVSILNKLSAATQSVERVSLAYAARAVESEARIQRNLDLLSEVPSDLVAVRDKAAALGAVVAGCIREAVKVVQGHDAIRQRLEHILAALAGVRADRKIEPGHTLALQREQAKRVLASIVDVGSRIERELNGVIGSAQSIAGDGQAEAHADVQVQRFEVAVDRLGSLSAEVAELLAGEVQMGNFVLTQIDPIRDLLTAKSGELETLARSMKRLALNVLIGAEHMPTAKGIDVLGAWTSEAAERVLKLARDLNSRFAQLGDTLQAQVAVLTSDVGEVACCREGLSVPRSNEALRGSRRTSYDEVARLSEDARQLRGKTESLVESLKFVDEGTELLVDLDGILGSLLDLYPKPEKAFDRQVATAGYTMREQHDVHATGSSGEANAGFARLTAVVEGEDYGENIELF